MRSRGDVRPRVYGRDGHDEALHFFRSHGIVDQRSSIFRSVVKTMLKTPSEMIATHICVELQGPHVGR